MFILSPLKLVNKLSLARQFSWNLLVSLLIHAGKNPHWYGRSVLGAYIIPSNTIPNVIGLLLGAKRGVTIKHFVTPNFVQAVFSPKHWDRRLKFCMQPQIMVIYIDHKEFEIRVIGLNFTHHEFRKYGKIPLFSL